MSPIHKKTWSCAEVSNNAIHVKETAAIIKIDNDIAPMRKKAKMNEGIILEA